MKLSKHLPDNKPRNTSRRERKSIASPRVGITKPSKNHTEVSIDEVRSQALMMSLQGFSPGGEIKSLNVSEKPKRRGRPKMTNEEPRRTDFLPEAKLSG